ncbi:MAG: DNA-binding transcriptional LysR family regulator [bacterium]|jgi:DNA-binding transcriptional LysR family regulator
MAKNPITIEALETLDAIDRRGSFAKAAEELNKATSAVSYAVQKLEEQLDIALFKRQGRRSVLTPAGQLILAEGRDILIATARLANKAKEVATGWEPRISIAVELHTNYRTFFHLLNEFLKDHPSIEIDIRESVLNGGWEALEQDNVDLIVGAPGPVPLQKGYRAISMAPIELVPVIACHHPQACLAHNSAALEQALPKLRRIIIHDTSLVDVRRTKGLRDEGTVFYVQTIEQKLKSIMAGIGIGHLPRQLVAQQLKAGELVELDLAQKLDHDIFLAWKVSNKGKGLQTLTKIIAAAAW